MKKSKTKIHITVIGCKHNRCKATVTPEITVIRCKATITPEIKLKEQ